MTRKPPYAIHALDEKDLTVDWFFGPGHIATKAMQLVLILIGWFFALLPVVVTASALLNRDNDELGWWSYVEGFALWDETMAALGFLLAAFIVGYLVLFLVNRRDASRRAKRRTVDEHRLEQRLLIADDMYAEKFGPPELRVQQSRVQIQPYADLETFELRGLYRKHGVQ